MRSLRQLAKDRLTLGGFVLALVLLGGLLALLLTRINVGAETETLHYNIYFGIDLAGPGIAALWPWAVALLLTLVNFVLAVAAAERDRLAGRLLAWFSVTVVVLTSVASLLVLSYQP